jgi:hypothetical protein
MRMQRYSLAQISSWVGRTERALQQLIQQVSLNDELALADGKELVLRANLCRMPLIPPGFIDTSLN